MNDLNTLLEQAKDFLNFTWEDLKKENKIRSYLISSMEYLDEVAGLKLDYENNYLANDLLMNRVLYMDSQALSDFNENYKGMLEELSIHGRCTENTDAI